MYQLYIILKYLEPCIWRRILVDRQLTLLQLNMMIQAAMGWKNQHRHEFIIKKRHYGYPDPENFSNQELRDSARTTISKVLRLGDDFVYIYDFGDAWEHHIVVEEIIYQPQSKVPLCLDGARACPPENCGGTEGYKYILQVLSDPVYEEYAYVQRWLGKAFEPHKFTTQAATRRMRNAHWKC